MTRTLSPTLAAALSAKPRKGGADCVVIEARDGTRVGLTTWDRPLMIDLGVGADPDLCNPGLIRSAVTLAAGLESSHFEMSGALTGSFTRLNVLGGFWRKAKVWLCWTSPTLAEPLPIAPILYGEVGDCREEAGTFVFEVRNAGDMFNQTHGGVLTPYCRTWFGSPQCGITRTPYPGEVTAVDGSLRFTVDVAEADHFFRYGNVQFTSGELAGVEEAKILSFVGGEIELFEPLLKAPEVGDEVTIYRGCSKLMKHDDPTLPTCVSYGNGVRHRGHPQVPGSRFYLKVSAPGTSYA